MVGAMPSETKTSLRREALRLFSERGYSAVSMRELAEAVGMHQGGIYNHFASKQALLADLMASHIRALLEAHGEAMADHKDPREQLAAFVRHHVDYHLDFPQDVFLAYMELRNLEPENRQEIVALRNEYEHALRDILRDGRDEGAFTLSDPAIHARMLLSMLTGATTWYREGGALSREEVVACHLQAALQSVGIMEGAHET